MEVSPNLYMPILKETNDFNELRRLSARLKELRAKTGLSAEQFAFENNIARSQYARYESGQDIRYTTLIKIIRAFEMTPEEFFNGLK